MLPLLLLLAALTGPAAAAPAKEAAADASAVESAWRRLLLSQFDFSWSPVKKRDVTDAQVALGRKLFFDAGLSRDGTLSCSTCHVPELGWTDGLPRARGKGRGKARKELERNTLSLLNVPGRRMMFWDSRAPEVEDAVLIAAANPDEMDMPGPELAARAAASPEYQRLFEAAFGTAPITAELAARALGAFVRTEPTASPWALERFAHDRSALTALQKKGLVLFTGKANCLRCHNGPFLTDNRQHDIGLVPGRSIRTPPLRNLTITAPYMDDGSLATLEDVVEFYDRGGDVGAGVNATGQDLAVVPLKLSKEEKRALVAFLEALGGGPPRKTVALVRSADPKKAPAAPQRAAENGRPADVPVPANLPDPPSPPSQAAAPARPAEKDCRGAFDVDRLIARLTENPDSSGLTHMAGASELVQQLAELKAAKAFHSKDLSSCAALTMAEPGKNKRRLASRVCAAKAAGMQYLEALSARDPSFVEVCDRAMEPELRGSGLRRKICAAVLAKIDDPRALCSGLVGEILFPLQEEACVFAFSAYSRHGEPGYCEDPHAGVDLRRRCVDVVSFARAKASGKPDDCEESDVCRAMLDASVQKATLERIRDIACLADL